MGVRNRKRQLLRRLDSKSLDARFLKEIEQGLNCSPFEAHAVLDFVYKTISVLGKAKSKTT